MRERFEVRVGGFYVNEGMGLVREVTHEDEDGKFHWRSYVLADGSPTGDMLRCDPYTLMQWADREATPAEVARMRRDEAQAGEVAETMELALLVLRTVSNERLFEEVRRRGRRVV
ncbi:MAG TPA: hypothetical protein VG406_00575 [Isosphaeraceae bacterium]|nr:hypothetical protein [Isosphaeraceae bacterium]